MTEKAEIRLATAQEAGRIVSLLRDSFTPRVRSAMIYSCSGVEEFVRQQIATPAALSDTRYLVAATGERILGCLELRRLSDALFLNYVCTNAEVRGKGLAKELLGDSIRLFRSPGHRDMYLDVFEDNLPAREWYERLGFRHDATSVWLDIPLTGGEADVQGMISGYPQARRCQETYGFSTFKLITSSMDYQVGCLGSDWFRVTQPEILADAEALSTLHLFDAQRRLLALMRDDRMPHTLPAGAREIVRSRRMTINLEQLLVNLYR
ncbi:GNAT family N-acetyltransferase [bacterium]|nr:GNAT family N-acetyltransferase [bacterium]